jgi:two-component system, NarL family, sensor kinase
MRNPSIESIIVFIVVCTLLTLLLISFITWLLFRYQQRQNAYFKSIAELNVKHENELLQSQLEIQEQTFQNISREIHDNIGQKLTLAKLQLNTLPPISQYADSNISDSVKMIGEAINDLSDISRSMSSEIILNNGLIKALEFEVSQLNKPGLFNVRLKITGNPVFLENQQELLLFRIVQEALNNIVKHASASKILLELNYQEKYFHLTIKDDGKGFDVLQSTDGTGVSHMRKRAALLKGECDISSIKDAGTAINIRIPINENNGQV